MIPVVKVTLELPIHYLEELQQIFENAERTYLGSFRGVVASRVSETFKQLLEKKKEYDAEQHAQSPANPEQLGQCVSGNGEGNFDAEQRPGHAARFGYNKPG